MDAHEQPDTSEDVDLVLRHISRQFPEQFARALLPTGTEQSAASWVDTQLTARQRRLDRALAVIADGQERREHTEWQMEMKEDLPFRIFEYHVMLALALQAEAPDPNVVVPVRSTVVLLSGRETPWPEEGAYRTSPRDSPFSGVTFRIDAVYQRKVRELEERGSLLWLMFAPLAVDADETSIARVVKRILALQSAREREELIAGMLVMADTDKRRRGFRDVIVPLLKKESIMQSWIYKQGEQAGIEKGVAQGIEKGLAQSLGSLRNALMTFYEGRFGPMPMGVRDRIQAAQDHALLDRWCGLVARASKEEVDQSLLAA